MAAGAEGGSEVVVGAEQLARNHRGRYVLPVDPAGRRVELVEVHDRQHRFVSGEAPARLRDGAVGEHYDRRPETGSGQGDMQPSGHDQFRPRQQVRHPAQ